MELYRKNNLDCSKITTHNYSTSFSLGVRVLNAKYRVGIYSIYGFVRYADEIVDTFFEQDQQVIFEEFRQETFKAIERKFSINPIIDSFQMAVHKFNIDRELIEAFLLSMEMDLSNDVYSPELLKSYIYGSAEVVGLMCLRVFYYNEPEKYDQLVAPARKLGEAFQKVNFLRDVHDDFDKKGRVYFKNIDFDNFTEETKKQLEAEIEKDFLESMEGIRQLKKQVRLGVYLAYTYYIHLLKEIKKARPEEILKKRYRITNTKKSYLLVNAYLKNTLNLL
ncbi:MAG: phytoene/squalene synthase family protein [Bacteroidota bacterium]|nr:phytoene synthase [Odoribacter sp.]MDP3642537.1 phytoene/squalene synthase family protein [Bacteroidota bacterium]